MKIGYDAKRAFFNQSGLGNYSRNLLNALFARFPENKYVLYSGKESSKLFNPPEQLTEIRIPDKSPEKYLPSYWRTFGLSKEIKKDNLDIYHGLSHELPYGIEKSGVKSIVTIHDLIFFRYPNLYKTLDRLIYKKKFTYACKSANRIVAVSRQTANDISEFLNADPDKIDVVYQGYNNFFENRISKEERSEIRKKYNLPQEYILYVGTIEERKNLLSLVKAVNKGKIEMPIVAIGRKTSYFEAINNYILKNNIKSVIFIDTVKNEELAGFYQMAKLFVYPSVFEGFGIPILESLVSETPVITSKGGCFAEAGGPGSLYINPLDEEEIASAVNNVLSDSMLREKMIMQGKDYAKNFTAEKIADNMMSVYKKITENEGRY